MIDIILTKENSIITSYCLKDNVPERLCFFNEETLTVGSIYVALVKQVKKEQEACFVEILPGQIGYLPFDKCLSKPVEGSTILVQVEKEPIKTKPYSVTEKIEICSENVVVSLSAKPYLHVSNKLSKEDRESCLSYFSSNLDLKSFGVVIRTNAIKNLEVAVLEAKSLMNRLTDYMDKGHTRTKFFVIYEPLFIQSLVDGFKDETLQIVTDDYDLFLKLKDYYPNTVKHYNDSRISLSAFYSLGSFLERATHKKIWLKCGGYLVIEPTEALTVIDINTGKCDSNKNKEVLKHKVNMEAVSEIALQLRLRNISGIIMIDFINEKENEMKELKDKMKQELKKDYVKASFSEITKLGIMELSRQKTTGSVYDYLKILC